MTGTEIILLIIVGAITLLACGIIILLLPNEAKIANDSKIGTWKTAIYDAFFKDTEPQRVAKFLGVNTAKYNLNCAIMNSDPDYKSIVTYKMFGIAFFVLFLAVGIASRPALILVGAFAFIPLFFLPTNNINNAAEIKRFEITQGLPRFLDLLHAALTLEMPVTQAIKITATQQKDTVIGQEMLRMIDTAELSSIGWDKALYNMAASFGVDSLSDLALDLTTAHKHGTSIAESVARKSKDIKQTAILEMKGRAARLTNTILFPILVFKILPLLAILCIPIIDMLNMSGFTF